MTCTVYELDLIAKTRSEAGFLTKHSKMNEWLKDYGDTSLVYEVWKGSSVHSRWCFKTRSLRWGRMATPRLAR